MTQTYFPFDAGAGANVTEDQWRKMAQHWLSGGVLRTELNKLEVFADTTGMQVKVKSGRAFVQGHYYESDAQEVLAIGAAHATLARIDRVVLRADFTLNTIALAVLAGTAAASPAAPALTQSSAMWEISLAQVAVPATDVTIDAAQVTDDRSWAVPAQGAGGQLGYAQAVVDQTWAAAGDQDLTSLSVAVLVGAARRIRITGSVEASSTRATSDELKLRIKEGATLLQERTAQVVTNGEETLERGVVLTPTAGLHTYKLVLNATNFGQNITALAAATRPNFILVEDIGPA